MERSEAIKYAKAICYCRGCVHYVYPIDESDGTDYCEECEHKEFWDKAIESLSQEPREKARWLIIENSHYPYKCSKCGNNENMKKNYCSFCGSDMRGK